MRKLDVKIQLQILKKKGNLDNGKKTNKNGGSILENGYISSRNGFIIPILKNFTFIKVRNIVFFYTKKLLEAI